MRNPKRGNLQLFHILANPEDTRTFFTYIRSNVLNGKDIVSLFIKQFFYFKNNADYQPLISLFREFLDLNLNENNFDNLQCQVIDAINKYQQNKQYYRIYNLFLLFINHLIDQNEIQTKFQKDDFRYEKDFPNSKDFNSMLKIFIDKNFNFYYKKTYNRINEELMNQEVEIYHTNFTNEYQSFIVHTNDKLDKNKITFPYFPFQTLRSFLNLVQNKETNIIFTAIDKFVIIKEICIGLEQLHEHSIYHQNLNSSCMMITNTKDSYISNFAFDLTLEQNQTNLVPSFYYRHPDLIKKRNSLTMDENLDESEKERYIKYDIYSFGVLIYEIITTSAIDDLFGNKTRQDRINILSDNYKNFLFSKYDEEQIDFNSKYGIKGIRKIIEKCMDTENTYSSMKEIILDLNKLPIYQTEENKKEIDYRITHVTKINEYKCTLSDLVTNYYLGNLISKELVISFFNKIDSKNSQSGSKICLYKFDYFVLEILHFFASDKELFYNKQFNFTKERIASMLINPINMQLILNPKEYKIKNGKIFTDFFDALFCYLIEFTSKKPLIESYKIFTGETNYSILKSKVVSKIEEFIKKEDYNCVLNLFILVLNNMFNQIKPNKGRYNLDVNFPNNESIYVYTLFIDEKYHFYVQKQFRDTNQDLINQEVKIHQTDFTNECSSFIVHSNNEFNNKKMIFPYFPFQTLKSFINLVQNKPSNVSFTPVDKFIIIKEIGIALNQLHSQSIFHLNLKDSSIMISNNKDSYICNFIFDATNDRNQTKSESMYYKHPDLIENPRSLSMDENLVESIKEKYIKYDIYSFGVLIYEIITTTSPYDLFGNKTIENRKEILSKNYKEFLFSKYDNEKVDFDSKYGIQGIRDIIEKCMDTGEPEKYSSSNDPLEKNAQKEQINHISENFKDEIKDPDSNYGNKNVSIITGKCVDTKNTYSSMKELFLDLDELQIYTENQNKIDDRIKNAINSKKYECKLSDIVINYYLGNQNTKNIIASLLTLINSLSDDENLTNFEYKDIISNILEVFEVKNENTKYEEETLVYEEKIKSIIQQELNQKIEQNYSNFTSNQTKLMSLSIKINEDPKQYLTNETNLITNQILTTMKCYTNLIPITSFDKFINKFKRAEMIPIYLYFIAKEISIIHSYGLYHGEISPKSIGIYYNTKTDTFLPSIIPFYFFFKNTQNKPTNNEQFLYEDRITFQRKDVKQFLKIIKRVDETELIPDDIYENETINSIIIQLYNLNISNENQNIRSIFIQNYENYQYSSFEFTFQKIHEIFTCYDKTSPTYEIIKYFLITNKDESYINLNDAINKIYEFICIKQSNELNSTENSLKETEIEEIELKLKKIKEINDNFITEYYEEQKTNYNQKMELKLEKNLISVRQLALNNKAKSLSINYNSFSKFKMKGHAQKLNNLNYKVVRRYLCINNNLCLRTYEFVFKRYINCLDQNINYDFFIIFISKLKNKYKFTSDDVKQIGKRIGLKNIKENIVVKKDKYLDGSYENVCFEIRNKIRELEST